jgi:hypothetical protein
LSTRKIGGRTDAGSGARTDHQRRSGQEALVETQLEKKLEPGDRITLERRRGSAHTRSGVVVEVSGEPGHERYLVRWDGDGLSYHYPTHHEALAAPPEQVATKPAEEALPPPARPGMSAQPGDRLVVHGHHLGEPERDAEILEVRGPDGGPPYLVRWQDTGVVATLYPGSDAAVEHIPHRATKPKSRGRRA